ncbi:MAG TPA: hypothetical protein VEK11_16645 [Thermoanaerobaculia bacterium]|nr:hypothetical protein [Thermoanaerobaculia bacterium]
MQFDEDGRHHESRRNRESNLKTRLQQWLDNNGYSSGALERATGIGRKAMQAIRRGRDVRKSTMIRVLKGARLLSGEPVEITDLFDFEPDAPENAPILAAA